MTIPSTAVVGPPDQPGEAQVTAAPPGADGPAAAGWPAPMPGRGQPPARDRASARDRPAGLDLAALFGLHHAELVRLAVLLVHDQQTAEDIVQDVFTRIHARNTRPVRNTDRGRDDPAERTMTGQPDVPLAYLRAAVLNGCRSVLRRRGVARRLGRSPELLAGPGQHESAEREVIREQDRRQVLAALAALPVRRREVLVLRYYLGLSEAQIAATLGISTGTVKSTASRGIAALARVLGEEA